MRLPHLFTLPLAAAAITATSAATAPTPVFSAPLPWEQKVDDWVLSTASAGPAEFLVFLSEQADVAAAEGMAGKAEKGRYVSDLLRDTAARTQGPLLAFLAGKGAEHRAYWVANMVWVRGDLALVEELALRDDVAHVYANPSVRFHEPVERDGMAMSPEAIEWGVARVRAPEAWAAGFTGQGVVIGGQDTGYEWDHPALKNKYRGWNGSAADHNYNWHDSIHSGGGSCGPNSPEPCDDGNPSHGTHTMGTMVGDDGAGNQVGVAPGAKWMGCRNMDQGNGTPATYSECFQWFIAPTNLANTNPDPTRAPHVINNSWACPPSEGCTNPDVLRTVVENTRAAGIVVVVSAGNSGSACATVNDPPAIYGASFSVGSTTIGAGDPISSFSSRGPVTIDGSNRLKPNISAPGSNIRSSLRGGGYGNLSGTSMAGPHVAGVTAVFLSAFPALRGQPGTIESALLASAAPRPTTETCGGIPGGQVPNNTYGYGRVDAWDAIRLRSADIALSSPPWPVVILTGVARTYTMTIDNLGPLTATGVTLDQPWPASFTINSATASQGSCVTGGNTIACTLGTILPGAAATVTATVTPNAPGFVMSRATANLAEFDLSLANNTHDFETTVETCPLATPVVTAPLSAPVGATGLQASVVPQPGHTYTWTVTGGTITGGQTTGQVTFDAGPAGTTMVVSVVDSAAGCDSPPGRRNVQVHFLDVPPAHSFHGFVNTLARNSVTSGCGSGNYCPDVSIPREQMAVFLLVAKEGAGYAPAACTTPMFADVPCSSPYARWINEIARRGITGGCGGPNFCPGSPVTREQMAVFLLVAREGAVYSPPACVTPTFTDVPCSNPFAKWIEELARRAITGGCGGGNYCPLTPNTRGEMAVFIVATFGLQ